MPARSTQPAPSRSQPKSPPVNSSRPRLRSHIVADRDQREIRAIRPRRLVTEPRPRRAVAGTQQSHADHAILLQREQSAQRKQLRPPRPPSANLDSAWHTSTALSRAAFSRHHCVNAAVGPASGPSASATSARLAQNSPSYVAPESASQQVRRRSRS